MKVRVAVARVAMGAILLPASFVFAVIAAVMLVPLGLLVAAADDEPDWAFPFQMLWEIATMPLEIMGWRA